MPQYCRPISKVTAKTTSNVMTSIAILLWCSQLLEKGSEADDYFAAACFLMLLPLILLALSCLLDQCGSYNFSEKQASSAQIFSGLCNTVAGLEFIRYAINDTSDEALTAPLAAANSCYVLGGVSQIISGIKGLYHQARNKDVCLSDRVLLRLGKCLLILYPICTVMWVATSLAEKVYSVCFLVGDLFFIAAGVLRAMALCYAKPEDKSEAQNQPGELNPLTEPVCDAENEASQSACCCA